TDVVHVVVACAAFNQSSTRTSVITGRMFMPPGTRMMSGRGTAVRACSATRATPASERLGPGVLATGNTEAPGRADKPWSGPIASSAVMPSKRSRAICMGLGLAGAPEMGAVMSRGHMESPAEGPVHGLDGAEAGIPSDLGQPGCAGLEAPSRRLHARALHVHRGRDVEVAAKGAGEVARAHPRPPGERRNGQILVGGLGDEALKVAEPVTLGDLRAELRAELRLAALPAQEEDEPARDLQSARAPRIFVHQVQGQVDPRGDTGRGGDRALADEDGVGLHADPWIAPRQLGTCRPVRGRAAAVEEARPRAGG